MKLIVNVFKSLAILYWVLAAGLFTSMLFFPSAIDTLYNGYTQFAEVIEVEEEPTCLALIPECGYYGEVETEEPVVEEESSEPVTEESEEPVVEEESSEPVTTEESVTCLAIIPECGWEFSLQSEPVQSYTETPVFEVEPVVGDKYVLVDDNDDLFYSLFVYEELATSDVCEEECPVEATFRWVKYQVSIVKPVEFTEDTVWYNVETGELFTAKLIQSIPEEESSEESSEPETTSDGEAAEVEDPSSEEPVTSEEETSEEVTDASEDDEVTCLALECEDEEEVVIDEETPVDSIPEEETVIDEEEYVFLPSITSREEFVVALESLLVYSAIIMLPFTILAFSIGKRLGSYSEEVSVSQTSEEKAKAKLLGKKAKVDKKLESIKSIGITGIKIKK